MSFRNSWVVILATIGSGIEDRALVQECELHINDEKPVNNPSQPKVSVLTPVYNGEKYLAECIESVLGQTYQNWDYTIVDNCSTDGSLKIAEHYASRDKRIALVSNRYHVDVIENHNIAFRRLSPNSKYCKVVSADDWLYPECIYKLVESAECSPSVGVLLGYMISVKGVRWLGVTPDKTVLNGREVGRLLLLGAMQFFAPSNTLYLSHLVRSREPFFRGPAVNADADAFLYCLQEHDCGFVHQILSFDRIRDESVTAHVREFHINLPNMVEILLRHGPFFLSREELDRRLEELIQDYYRTIAVGILNLRGAKYLNYHRERLKCLGYRFYSPRMAKAVCMKMMDLCLNPKTTIEKALGRFKEGP